MHNKLKILLKIIIAGALITWMVQKGFLQKEQMKLFLVPQYLLCFVLIMGANIFINNYRWYSLMKAQGFSVTYWKTLSLTLIGTFFNYAIPSSIGGDVVKAYYVIQDNPSRKTDAGISVIVDRILGVYMMITISLVTMSVNLNLILSSEKLLSIFYAVILIFFGVSLFIALSLSTRVKEKGWLQKIFKKIPGGPLFEKIYLAFQSYRSFKKTIFMALVISALAQLMAVFFVYFVGYFLMAVSFPISAYFFVVPLGFILSALPIAPAGVGVGQVAFLYLFTAFTGEEHQVGPVGITLLQMTVLLWGLVGAFFYLKRKKPVLEVTANG